MKKTVVAVIILALAVVSILRRNNGQRNAENALTNDTLSSTWIVETDISSDATNLTNDLSPELQAKLDAQTGTGDKITEEDIKLIENILDQVTSGVQNTGTN